MRYVIEMIVQGVRLLHHDPYLGSLTTITVRLGLESTVIAALFGFPLACVLGLGRSHVSRRALVVANAGLGLPPVAVGVFGALLLVGSAPWGGFWLGTLNGMVLAQTVLAFPIIVALGAIAIRRLAPGLIEQATAFGASGWRLAVFALREARIGVATAVIVALGSAFAEVGAVTLIGGNGEGATATLASQILNDVNNIQTGIPAAVEHLIVLLGLMAILGIVFTIVQQSGSRSLRRRPRTGGASASPAEVTA